MACILVLCCSISLQGYVFTKYSYSTEIHSVKNVSLKVHTCKSHFTVEERFTKSIVQFTIGLWIPLVMTIVCHFLMYRALLVQEKFSRILNCSVSHREQLRGLSIKFFVIICAFYTCILPLTIVETYITYKKYRGLKIMSPAKYHMMLSLCTLLMNFNSSLNPLIYANLHIRLYACILWIFNTLISFCRRSSASGGNSKTSKGKYMDTIEMVETEDHEMIELNVYPKALDRL